MTLCTRGVNICRAKRTAGHRPAIPRPWRPQMNRSASLLAGIAAGLMSFSAAAADVDWTKIDQAIGKKGALQPGGVYKFGLPRSDLKVTVDGVAINPALALGSWVAFQPTADGAMLMGDLVLTDLEISPVM